MSLPVILAHHPIVSAIPFVVPMIVVAAGLGFLMLRDRLGG